jgi:hypothetical protein
MVSTVQAVALDAGLTKLTQRMTAGEDPGSIVTQFPDGMVSMFVQGDLDEPMLQSLGGGVGTAVGPYRTIRVPAVALDRFLASRGLRTAQLAEAFEPQTINTAPSTGANTLWSVTPQGAFSGTTGKGVIVGIIDTGIDFRHKDFKKADGTTRILNIWDQTFNSTPPTGFAYGAEWSAAQINAGQCTQVDGNGHGTFIAGVAAGNGQGTIAGLPAYRYVGMAPEADIIVVKSYMYDTYYCDAVKYVFQKAQALGKPAVCLIAAGKRDGPHDGTDPSEITISNLVRDYGPNRLVVTAMGNYGASPIHGRTHIPDLQSSTVSFNIPTLNQAGDISMNLQGWYESGNSFSITLRTPRGYVVGPVQRSVYLDTETGDAGVIVSNGGLMNPQGDRRVDIVIRRSAAGLQITPGTYQITITSVTGSGDVDFWIADYSLNGAVPTITAGLDFGHTVITPATADSTISVGAFTYRSSWLAANGTTYGLSGSPVVNDIAAWSGRGFRRDGAQSPDITAPGQAIGSSRSGWASVSGSLILPDSVHMIRTGTSVAAAHVAGALALELQSYKNANRNLSVKMAKQLLGSLALKDSYTGASPNEIWGYGKLHLTNGVTGVDEAVAERFQFSAPFPNPSVNSATFQFALGAGDLAEASRRLELQLVDVRGRLVRSIRGVVTPGSQRLVWDGLDSSGQRTSAGIYFANLVVGDKIATRKLVRITP